jgi:hypothetical protein
MAKILPTLGALSGSIRGNVFSHNKGGAYVRGRTIPTNPTSLKQSAARAVLATLSSQWATITAGQRADWEQWAALYPLVDALGQSFQRSGQQAFVGLNARLLQAGTTAVLTCPATTGPGDLLTLVVTATAPTGISAAFTATPLAAGKRILLWQTLPTSPGRNPNRRQARLIGYTAAAAASPAVFVSPYPALVGQASNFWGQVMDAAGQVSAGIKASGTYV